MGIGSKHSAGRPPGRHPEASGFAQLRRSLYTLEFEAFQKSLFERVIREAGGNRAEAARRLGWHPNSFRRRFNEVELNKRSEP